MIKDYIKDENIYEYNYITKMMKTLGEMLNYEKIENKFSENRNLMKNYQLNCIRYISLISEIVDLYIDEDDIKIKKDNNIIFEDEQNENIL